MSDVRSTAKGHRLVYMLESNVARFAASHKTHGQPNIV